MFAGPIYSSISAPIRILCWRLEGVDSHPCEVHLRPLWIKTKSNLCGAFVLPNSTPFRIGHAVRHTQSGQWKGFVWFNTQSGEEKVSKLPVDPLNCFVIFKFTTVVLIAIFIPVNKDVGG